MTDSRPWRDVAEHLRTVRGLQATSQRGVMTRPSQGKDKTLDTCPVLRGEGYQADATLEGHVLHMRNGFPHLGAKGGVQGL